MSLYPRADMGQFSGHVLTSAPAAEPIDAAFVKDQARITFTDEDDYITALIAEAREQLEAITGLAFITQSWKLTLDDWPTYADAWWSGVREMPRSELYRAKNSTGTVYLPRYPLVSVDTVITYDYDDTGTAEAVSDLFYVDTAQTPGRLRLRFGQTWPIANRLTNGVEIVYTSGFGALATDVPAPLRRAICLMVAYFYDRRGECSWSSAYANSGARDMVSNYATIRI